MNHLTLSPSLRSIGSSQSVVADVEIDQDQAETEERNEETVSGAAHELAKQQARAEVGGAEGTCSWAGF